MRARGGYRVPFGLKERERRAWRYRLESGRPRRSALSPKRPVGGRGETLTSIPSYVGLPRILPWASAVQFRTLSAFRGFVPQVSTQRHVLEGRSFLSSGREGDYLRWQVSVFPVIVSSSGTKVGREGRRGKVDRTAFGGTSSVRGRDFGRQSLRASLFQYRG